MKTMRDVKIKPQKTNNKPTYFDLHLLVKQQERLTAEKETLLKRLGKIDQRLSQLAQQTGSLEQQIKGPQS